MTRKVVGLLFADVEGYSGLEDHQLEVFIAKVSPGVAAILARYKEHLLEVNTWGDGLVVAAEDPHRLVRLALDLRDFYESTNWLELHFDKQLAVRIALHAGAVYVGVDPIRGVNGVTGVQVSRAARIEPVTPKNTIWASNELVILARTKKDPTVKFHAVGSKELAKRFGAEELFCVERADREPSRRALGLEDGHAGKATNP